MSEPEEVELVTEQPVSEPVAEPEPVSEPEPQEPIFGAEAGEVWTLTPPAGSPVKYRAESLEDAVRLFNDSGHTSFTAKQLRPNS